MKLTLVKNLAANLYGQFITVAWQLALIPIFLRAWQTSLYGDWLVLFSLPALLNIMESGLGTVIANEAVMRSAGSDPRAGLGLLNAGTSLIFYICCVGMVLSCGAAVLVGWTGLLHLELIAPRQQTVILTAFAASVFLNLPNSIVAGYYRLSDENARGVYFVNSFRLAGLIAMASALLTRQSATTVALCYLVSQATMAALTWWDISRRHRVVLGSPRQAFAGVRGHLTTAISFQLFPIGNAVYFHGQTLLVKALLNSDAVVVFTTTRTLSRVIAQLATLIKHSVWPEFTRLKATNRDLLQGLVKKTTLYVALVSIAAGLVLLAAYPQIFRLWTHGAVQVSFIVALVFIAAAVLNAVWAIPVGFLQATNLHSHSAKAYAIVCILSLVVSIAFCGVMDGILGFGVGMLLSELAMTYIVLQDSRRWLNSSTPQPAGR